MATHRAAVRKWPHVDCCIATTVNLHGYCSEEVALCWFVMFHTLKTSILNTLNLVQFMVPHSNDFTSNLEALLKVLYCWETIPLTVVTLFTFRQLVLLILPQNLPTMLMMLDTPMWIFMLQTFAAIKVPTTMEILHR